MKTLILKAGQLGLALVMIAALTGSMGQAQAQGGANDWTTHTESRSVQTEGGQSISITSEQQSGDGQSATSNETHTDNEDGSADEHDEHSYDDGKGEDGLSGNTRTDSHRDLDGTWKVHHEEIVRENGKCEIVSWDDVYDKNHNLIKRGERQEKPCDLYSLEMKLKGHVSGDDLDFTWGPNVVIIPLQRTGDDIYEGHAESTLTAAGTAGDCSGVASFPGSFEVTATEDRLNDTIDFTVTAPLGMSAFIICPDAAGPGGRQPASGIPLTFQLAAEEGASKVYSMDMPEGNITFTFTLRVNPQSELGPGD